MDHMGIRAFLATAKAGNISRAAEELFATSSTIGKQIRKLEAEVGAPLLERGKGKKTVSLTAAGEKFLPLAEDWLRLWSDMTSLDARALTRCLSVGVIDSIATPLIVPLLKRLQGEHPELKLRVLLKPSLEMYREIETRNVDMAFTMRECVSAYAKVERLFSEPFVVVKRSSDSPMPPAVSAALDFPVIDPAELGGNDELFIAWDDHFLLWHDQYWDRNNPRVLTLNNPTLLITIIEDTQWAIMPLSNAYAACRQKNLSIFSLNAPPPPRTCYLLTHWRPKQSVLPAIDLFLSTLRAVLSTHMPWTC